MLVGVGRIIYCLSVPVSVMWPMCVYQFGWAVKRVEWMCSTLSRCRWGAEEDLEVRCRKMCSCRSDISVMDSAADFKPTITAWTALYPLFGTNTIHG